MEEPGLGIAPLIDIVFLLLIFFMVTSHFDVASGVRIELPKVAGTTHAQRESKVTIIIDKDGQSYLEGGKIDMKGLGERLRNLVQEKNEVHLVLQADKDSRHGVVVQAMDVAKTAGVRSIVIAAQWKAEKVF
ncbi:MAG: biopolymer transporter ExbD [Desulfobacterales bacterium]|nr:biopolymer transporter ExbD [Desulfobacterales bacterium]